MTKDLTQYRTAVDRLLEADVARYKGQVPEHLLSVLRGYLTGGKRLRPVLLLLCCEGFGGSAEDVLPAAAAVEMYHNWTLIHDDVIDHDSFRRGHATGHVTGATQGREVFGLTDAAAADYGTSVAILSGDLLHGMCMDKLASLQAKFPAVVPGLLARMGGRLCRDLISGEQLDVELSHMDFEKVNEPLLKLMIANKTGALFRFSVECGTALGLNTLDDERIAAMGRFGNQFGLSFQLQDDLLGIFGDAKLGKPVGSDIREGKRTLLAVRTLKNLKGNARKRFLELYGRQELTQDDIEEVRAMMRESGAAESVRRSASNLLEQSLQILRGVMAPSEEYRTLVDLLRTMLSRDV